MHEATQPTSVTPAETDSNGSSLDASERSISLVLPAWNEAESIGLAISEADQALRQLTKRYEIIIVDDGSSDATAERVRRAAQVKPCVRLVSHAENAGYGAALRSGFAAATCDLVAFTDADRQFDLTELDRFVLLSRQYEVVCGYRIDRKDTALRCLYSRVYNQLVRILLGTGVRDVDCALKMFHRESIRNLKISTDGFLVNSELLTEARTKNYGIVEVGVSHRPRTEGMSTVSVTHIPAVLMSLVRYWWNVVQFPATTLAPQPCREDDDRLRWARYSLILVAAIFLFSNLGYPLIDRDETRYAEIPREMLVTGNWILPQLNFAAYYDKPPLLYWLCAISYNVFGVSEWAARFVPALSAMGTILATLWFGSRHFGRRAGLMSGGILMLSVGFVFSGRYLLIDGLLTLLVTLSLFSAYEAINGPAVRLRWWIVASICCGLAFLTKGPLSLVLLLPPVIAMAWLSNAHARPSLWHYGLLVTIVGGIVSPWLIAVSMHDDLFLIEFFYRHNVRRFAGEFHSKPLWYFLPVLLIAGHPWTFLTIPYARFLTRRSGQGQANRPPLIGFLLLSCGWCFVFFSLSHCKLPTYLLPAAPAAALMLGHYLHHVTRQSAANASEDFASFWSARMATATTCLAGVGFVTYGLISESDLDASLGQHVTMYVWGLLWVALFTGSVLMIGDRHQSKFAWASSAGTFFLLAVMVMHQMVPEYSRGQTIFGGDSNWIRNQSIAQSMPIATVSHEFSEVPFYLHRNDIKHFDQRCIGELGDFATNHGTALIVLDRRTLLGQLREQLPAGSRIQLVDRRGPGILLRVTTPRPSGGQSLEEIARTPGAMGPGLSVSDFRTPVVGSATDAIRKR